jgi:hypothetical protein
VTLGQHLDKVFAVIGPRKKTATADYQMAVSGTNRRKPIPSTGIEFSSVRREKADSGDLPGTLPGTVSANETADLVELARVLAGLTPEERSALLALAQGLRSPAT